MLAMMKRLSEAILSNSKLTIVILRCIVMDMSSKPMTQTPIEPQYDATPSMVGVCGSDMYALRLINDRTGIPIKRLVSDALRAYLPRTFGKHLSTAPVPPAESFSAEVPDSS